MVDISWMVIIAKYIDRVTDSEHILLQEQSKISLYLLLITY